MEQTKKTEAVKVEATPVVTQQRATRASRIPVSGPRDILTIPNKDPVVFNGSSLEVGNTM
jgi:hypothetical protein